MRHYKENNTKQVDWQMAAAFCIEKCQEKGIYDPLMKRGLGVWDDDGRTVLHQGDVLVVDGSSIPLQGHKSRYTYDKRIQMNFFDNATPLTAKDCQLVMDLCKAVRWDDPFMAYLFAGWCAVAPFCGAWKWRAHVWITGAAGGGKSWTLKNLALPLLGAWPLFVKAGTTEAGLRGRLLTDARPVIFDEVQGEDKGEMDKIKGIMDLMRQASSDDNASIMKGTQTGGVNQYIIRSCFLFSSIGLGIKQHADETRVSVLSIRTPSTNKDESEYDAQKFAQMEKSALGLTPEYISRLHARTLGLIPTIRKNAKVFQAATSVVCGTRRAGDQMGILLAGAYSLCSSGEITFDEATRWLSQHDVTAMAAEASDPDYLRCFNYLMQSFLRAPSKLGSIDMSIGELLDIARAHYEEGHDVPKSMAIKVLSRNGVMYMQDIDSVAISNTHSGVSQIFRNTAWPANWAKVLKQNPLAGNNGGEAVYFSGGAASRVVTIPLPAAMDYSKNQNSHSSSSAGAGSTRSDDDIPF